MPSIPHACGPHAYIHAWDSNLVPSCHETCTMPIELMAWIKSSLKVCLDDQISVSSTALERSRPFGI